MLKALVENSLLWETSDTSLATCIKLGGENTLSSDATVTATSYKFIGA